MTSELERELLAAMRNYIAQSLEQIKADAERLHTVRRELDEIKQNQK